ncbi:epoxide hydrolase family protein [Hyphomonas oceanitis]|uniref:Epoxide hydrolase-like protein n=1 Tax=Hyphomonas oceanitis SCH89 TaxID=1280953 RepID=A0A059G0W9_9PROT|nr:epoxide hydrolase family protein [Hyphomonas oceanitis]KCZ97369.1 Epoxide hydrolase-like protein [Hyphomonas oceanitis SCH89]
MTDALSVSPFRSAVPAAAVADLKNRLRHARWPMPLDGESWQDGTSVAFLRRLIDYWQNDFDWPREEARLNRLPQFMAHVDGQDIHFLHHRGTGPNPMPLVMTHGWPGSFLEMEHIVPLLTDPAAHGGAPADAFDVVVPSLPGYGFSPAPTAPGMNSQRIANLWAGLMAGLGYDTFGAQGGDIGAGVSTWLARLYPDRVKGFHLNYIPGGMRPSFEGEAPPMTEEEAAFLATGAAWSAEEGAYAALHATKPQTLAFALTDSPIGLAAWIAEKFRSWSDCDGDLEGLIPMDVMLRDISLYWFGQTIDASLRLYKENRANPLIFAPGERIHPPFGMALFPKELPTPPRSWVERVFDVRRWSAMPRGGHFAALEQPELLADEIRSFFRPLRD